MQRSCEACGGKGKVDVPLSGGASVLRRACLPCSGTGKLAGPEPRRRNTTATAGIACGAAVGLLLLCMLLLRLLAPTLTKPAPDAASGPAKPPDQFERALATLLQSAEDAGGREVAEDATEQLEELVARIV